MMNVLINFDVRGDNKGYLIALEENKNIPFIIKRVFYIFGTKDKICRGQHAHYETKQLLICVNGSCKVLLDDGKQKKEYILNTKETGLFQNEMIWGKMYDFSPDCVLMVLANKYYDEKDYIRDYDNFLKVLKNNDT